MAVDLRIEVNMAWNRCYDVDVMGNPMQQFFWNVCGFDEIFLVAFADKPTSKSKRNNVANKISVLFTVLVSNFFVYD